jgi:predicted RND superfamily exporter protein
MKLDPRGPTAVVSGWLIRWRWVFFVASTVVTAAGIWPSMQLRFDASIISLFPEQDPILQAYLDSVRVFGGGETLVVAYRDPKLLTPEGLERLHDMSDRLRTLQPAVPQVASLADARWPPEPLDGRPLYKQVAARELSTDQIRDKLLAAEMYRNLLLAEDGETTAILLSLRPKQSDEEREHVIQTVRRIARENAFPTYVAGGPMLTYDASTYVDQDSFRLGWASTLVLSLVIGVLFRRIRWVVLPLAVVHATLVWTKAGLWLVEAKLSMVSTTLTALVTVVGVAAVVQVTARYREERERAEPRDALLATMALAGPAVFWASLTTAAGFGSLLITSIVPVQHFAMMLSLASMLVFFTAAAITPAVVLFGRRPADPGAAPGEAKIEQVLERTMEFSLHRPWLVGIAFLLLLGLTALGIMRIRGETDFTKNFRKSAPIVTAYNFVERELGGAGTIEVEFAIPAAAHPLKGPGSDERDTKRITFDFVNRMREFEKKLRADASHPAFTKVIGISDVLDFVEGGAAGGLGQMAAAMLGPQGKLDGELAILRKEQSEFVTTFWNEESDRMRFLVRAREQEPSHVKDELLDWLHRSAAESLGNDGQPADVRVTGVYTLLNHLVSGLMADQLNTFLLATGLVFLVMWLALRSIRLAFVGLVPKLGPILMVLGAMGWLGVPIDMGTPMIAAVSMGLSVGFSIHYLYRFRQERAAGAAFHDALRATHRRVGGAMVFSNLALVVGFAVLSLSNFIPTVHFSLLANVALVGGLAGNLLVLPLLLRWVVGDPKGSPANTAANVTSK